MNENCIHVNNYKIFYAQTLHVHAHTCIPKKYWINSTCASKNSLNTFQVRERISKYTVCTCNVNSNMNVLQCTHNIVHCYIITCTWTDLSLASVVYSLLPRDPMKENNRPVSPSLQDCCNVLVWKVIRVHVTQCTLITCTFNHYTQPGVSFRGAGGALAPPWSNLPPP